MQYSNHRGILEVYVMPGDVLELYNIPNTGDNFACNFHACAGSFDRFASDPLLATSSYVKISDNFQSWIFDNYSSFALVRWEHNYGGRLQNENI